MPPAKNQEIRLTVASLSNDGNGVGRIDGDVVFVPHTAPGDEILAKVVAVRKGYCYARLESVLSPGPGRVPEDCPVSRRCGGCSFRHLSYEAELQAKHGFVADAFSRIGKLDVDIPPVMPSLQVDGYRNKVQYPVANRESGGLDYGFYSPRSHRVVPCAQCRLQPSGMNELAAQAAALAGAFDIPAYDEPAREGVLRHICIRQSGASGEYAVCFVAAHASGDAFLPLAKALCEQNPAVKTVSLNLNSGVGNVIFGRQTIPLLGDGFLRDELCGVPLKIGPTSFSQVNSRGAAQLFTVAASFAGLSGGETLLDLYCGTGVIGLSMAGRCKKIVGVEVNPEAISCARESAREMGAENAAFLCADAAEAAAKLRDEELRPDVVVLDPPRKGCDAATLAAVVEMAPRRVVYVSCSPATLARDAAILARQGYAVEKVQPVDMFPRTRHVETVVLMTRQDKLV